MGIFGALSLGRKSVYVVFDSLCCKLPAVLVRRYFVSVTNPESDFVKKIQCTSQRLTVRFICNNFVVFVTLWNGIDLLF